MAAQPTHTPVKCVTVQGLLDSYAILSRLLRDQHARLTEELAAEIGVSIGDRVAMPGRPSLWVDGLDSAPILDADMQPAGVELVLWGGATRKSATTHTVTWSSECRIVKTPRKKAAKS